MIGKNICPNCGKEMKKRKRRNFPHGKKSKGKTSIWYVCKKCNHSEYIKEEHNTKQNIPMRGIKRG